MPCQALLRATLIVAIGLVPCVVMAADDPAPAPAGIAVVTGTDVNVRAGPSVDFRDLGKLQRDDLVVVVGEDGDWTRLRVPGGLPVFVHATLVDWETGALHGVVKGADVLMRATPGQAYAPLHDQRLQQGEELIVLERTEGTGGPWLRVLPPARVHVWMHRRYVRASAPARELTQRLAAARLARRDAYTDGRTRVEREALARAREQAFRAELTALHEAPEILLPGHMRAVAELVQRAPTDALRRRAQAYHDELAHKWRASQHEVERRAASGSGGAGGDDGGRGGVDAEPERRAKDSRESAQDATRRRAEAERERRSHEREERERRESDGRGDGRGAPLAEGEVERDGLHLVIRVGGTRYRLHSRRYRLTDFAGRRVRVWGTRQGTSDLLYVDFLEFTARE